MAGNKDIREKINSIVYDFNQMMPLFSLMPKILFTILEKKIHDNDSELSHANSMVRSQ
jgi:hypothetical protein